VYVTTSAQSHHSNDCAVAIDRESGVREWMSGLDAMEVRGTPALAGGILYFVDLDGWIFAIDVADGSVIRLKDDHSPSPLDGVYPLIYNGSVFTNQYYVEARETESLEVQWRSDDEFAVEEPVALADEKLFAGGYRTTGERIYIGQDEADLPSYVVESEPLIRAFDTTTGVIEWETALDGVPRAPTVVGNTVFVPTDGSSPQGKRVSTIQSCTDEQPIPDEEPAEYQTFGSVHALDITTGMEYWSTRLSGPARTMPAVTGNYICFGTTDGDLVTLDANTGELAWRRSINDDTSVLSSPIIANDTIYVGAGDSHLLALDLHTGDELWRFETDAAVDANPSLVDEVLYFADNSGIIYALE